MQHHSVTTVLFLETQVLLLFLLNDWCNGHNDVMSCFVFSVCVMYSVYEICVMWCECVHICICVYLCVCCYIQWFLKLNFRQPCLRLKLRLLLVDSILKLNSFLLILPSIFLGYQLAVSTPSYICVLLQQQTTTSPFIHCKNSPLAVKETLELRELRLPCCVLRDVQEAIMANISNQVYPLAYAHFIPYVKIVLYWTYNDYLKNLT